MPLVRISLLKGKSPAYIRAIADGVHNSLISAFSIPPDDRFQLIQQHSPSELIYDSDYMGIHRTDDVVFVHIVAGNWRDSEKKKKLYKTIVESLAKDPGLREEDVVVVLSGNERDDWSFGKGLASYVKDTA